MVKYIIYPVIAIFISLIATPFIGRLAEKFQILDYPSERKIHKKPVPLLGGIPIFIAFNIVFFIAYLFHWNLFDKFLKSKWIYIFISQLIILGIGVYDDTKKVRQRTKFLFQLLAGFLLVLIGFGIPFITNPFTGQSIHLGILSIPLTILWVVGITNALNLIDGLDGLAAGISLIACVTIFGISYIYQNIGIAIVSSILAGSIIGFLKYNLFPARIFLGDSGSLFLGFTLAVISIRGVHKGATLAAVFAPLLALGLPIIETILSMARRLIKSANIQNLRDRKNSKLKSILLTGFSMFEADNDHIHHRLLKLGFTHQKAVIMLYGICIVLSFLAFLTVVWKNLNISLFLAAIILSSFIGIKSLNYQEFRALKTGLLLPLFRGSLINQRIFQAFIDLFFISLSSYFSFTLVFQGFNSQAKDLFIETIPLVLALKISIFYLSGLYKGSWKYSSLEDFLKIGKSLIFSSLASFIALVFFFGLNAFRGYIYFILEFYFLLTFVAGSRISYRIINHYYHGKNMKKGKNILIYGAGRKGALLARELHYSSTFSYAVKGFIDDDVRKKGKTLHDFSILGTIHELEQFIDKHHISEIILSTNKISEDKIRSLKNFCEERDVNLQFFELKIGKIYKT